MNPQDFQDENELLGNPEEDFIDGNNFQDESQLLENPEG